MADYIEDCDVHAASSYAVTLSHGHRVLKKVDLKARVDTETGEVTFYVPMDKISILRD